MANKYVMELNTFVGTIKDLLLSDRDVNLGVGGFTGEGKSCFSTQILKEYYYQMGLGRWNYNNMTWSRKELLRWISGKKKGKVLGSGLIEGQLPEYSGVLIDELFMLFYRRNWFDTDQIGAIGTLNYCRDRHFLIAGNVPNFWDLDTAFQSRIRFYAYIASRGVAWIFEQENNPFTNDVWNTTKNRNMFRKFKNPYACPNFVGEIHFKDWTPKEKELYYRIRNKKRITAIDDNQDDRKERYKYIKLQRDKLIRMMYNINEDYLSKDKEACKKLGIMKLNYKEIADYLDISQQLVRMVVLGDR